MARRLVLSGQLELTAARRVRLALDEALAHGAAEVDLAGVEKLDGVAAIVAGRARSGLLSVPTRPTSSPCWTLPGTQRREVASAA